VVVFAAGQNITDEDAVSIGRISMSMPTAAKYDFTIASNFMSTVDSTTMLVLNPWDNRHRLEAAEPIGGL